MGQIFPCPYLKYVDDEFLGMEKLVACKVTNEHIKAEILNYTCYTKEGLYKTCPYYLEYSARE